MTPEEEERLMTALRRAAQAHAAVPGPAPPTEDIPVVPEHVMRFARDSLRWRLPGAELAELAGRVPVGAAVRAGPGAPQLLRFAVRKVLIEIELSALGGTLDLAGQIVPVPSTGCSVDIRTTDLQISRRVSPAGQFAATRLAPGWLSVVYRPPRSHPVVTQWIRVEG